MNLPFTCVSVSAEYVSMALLVATLCPYTSEYSTLTLSPHRAPHMVLG